MEELVHQLFQELVVVAEVQEQSVELVQML
jgi:hypothetical protein